MLILTVGGLFSGLPVGDPHDHIAKLRYVYKSCVGRTDMDMNVIGLRVFPLSLEEMPPYDLLSFPTTSFILWIS